MTSHLHPRTLQLLAENAEKKTLWMKEPKWTSYEYADRLLREISLTVKQPPCHRMPSMLLIGKSNNGKTMILERALKAHPPITDIEAESNNVPVIFITMPPRPDLRRFYSMMLKRLGALFKESAATSVLEIQTLTLCESLGLRSIIIDEFHNVARCSVRSQHEFLNMLRFLSNELRISFVAAGIDSAARVIASDPQLASRFRPYSLHLWKVGVEYRKLLYMIESLIPLPEPSFLYKNEEIAQMILTVGEGNLGDMIDFLKEATYIAFDDGSPSLTVAHFRDTGFVPKSVQAARLRDLAKQSHG